MDKKSWREIEKEERGKTKDNDLFELWKFFGEKTLKDVGAEPDTKGWIQDHQNGKRVYVWVGEDEDKDRTDDAYKRAMGVI